MKLSRRITWTAAVAVALAGTLAVPQSALAATVSNGGFETGDLTGWTAEEQPGAAGEWSVYQGTSSPLSDHDVAAPPCATHAAVSDQSEESSAVLYQDLVLEAGQTHSLTFTHYYDNHAVISDPNTIAATTSTSVALAPGDPLFASPDTLDYNLDGDNQQYRVDIMTPTADPFSVLPADVLLAVFQTQPGDPAVLAPTAVTVDLSAFAGQTVRLRFAEVDNASYFNVGVDCVALQSTPIATTTLPVTTTTAAPAAEAVQAAPAFTG